jgi:hypothetical protein
MVLCTHGAEDLFFAKGGRSLKILTNKPFKTFDKNPFY